MAKRGTKAGDFYVEGHADTEQLKRDMGDARASVERDAQAMGESIETNTAKKFQDASSKVTSFIGSVTAMLGVAYVFERLGEKINKIALGFLRSSENARDFRQEVSRFDIARIESELDGLNDSVTSWTSVIADWYHRFNDTLGFTEETSRAAKVAILEEERARRQEIAAQERQLELEERRAQVEKDRARAAADRRSSIDAENEQLEIDALAGEDRIRAERERAERAVIKRIGEEEDDLAVARLRRQLDLIRQKYDAELQAFRDSEQEKERLAKESAERQAKAFADALSSAMNNALRQQSTAQSFAGPVEDILRRIESRLDAMKHGGL